MTVHEVSQGSGWKYDSAHEYTILGIMCVCVRERKLVLVRLATCTIVVEPL